MKTAVGEGLIQFVETQKRPNDDDTRHGPKAKPDQDSQHGHRHNGCGDPQAERASFGARVLRSAAPAVRSRGSLVGAVLVRSQARRWGSSSTHYRLPAKLGN